MLKKLVGLVKEEKGQGMTEYGLVLGIIAVAVVGLIAAFRNEIILIFDQALTDLKGRSSFTTPTTQN